MSGPARRSSPGMAALLLVALGGLIAANAVFGALAGVATGADLSFVALVLVVALAAARALRAGARWAWWVALGLGAAGLFFVLPVTGTILLGGSLEPVGTGWDVVFFPATTAVSAALLVALWTLRRGRSAVAEDTLENL